MDEKIRIYRAQSISEGRPILKEKSFELLMQTVISQQPKSILEIGVNSGITGIARLMHCGEASLTGIEIDEDNAALAKNNYKEFNVQNRAKIFIGDASEIIPVLTGEYDLIFLDGPKSHYHEYLPHLLSVLKKGGILFADNVLFRGYVKGDVKTPHKYNTIKNGLIKFLKAITEDDTLESKIYEIEDGVSITKKL